MTEFPLSLPPIDERTALLICDVQTGFITTSFQQIPERIERLQKYYPLVIATRFYNEEHSAFRHLMKWDRFAKGGAETSLAFSPLDKAIILDKPHYSCVSVDFLAHLEKHNIETVHIVGCDTNMCIFISAVDLFETNFYRPVVLAPYCASHSGKNYHESALPLLEKAVGGAQIWGWKDNI